MRKELDDLLVQKYPEIFSERNGDKLKTNMVWGFQHGDGWFDLLDVLSEQLQGQTDHAGAPQAIASQVKEKFGMLRFYTHPGLSETQRGMIKLAQAMSVRICEVCGRPGELDRSPPWVTTRCEEHRGIKQALE